MSRHELGDHARSVIAANSLFRLYRAAVSEHWVLIAGRDPVRGSGVDRSQRIVLD